MGKDKLRKFAENLTFKCMVQPEFDDIFHKDHPLKGNWHKEFFHNDNPIVLELGCGRGEYTVALAERNPDKNYIGIDIKGARMWRGAKTATERNMANVGFVRTRIEFIQSFFAEGEVAEIWITFPITTGLSEGGYDSAKVATVASFQEAMAALQPQLKAGDVVLYENDLPDSFK